MHPIEGVTIAMEELAQVLPSPVYGVQCTVNAPSSSLEELALFYIKVIA